MIKVLENTHSDYTPENLIVEFFKNFVQQFVGVENILKEAIICKDPYVVKNYIGCTTYECFSAAIYTKLRKTIQWDITRDITYHDLYTFPCNIFINDLGLHIMITENSGNLLLTCNYRKIPKSSCVYDFFNKKEDKMEEKPTFPSIESFNWADSPECYSNSNAITPEIMKIWSRSCTKNTQEYLQTIDDNEAARQARAEKIAKRIDNEIFPGSSITHTPTFIPIVDPNFEYKFILKSDFLPVTFPVTYLSGIYFIPTDRFTYWAKFELPNGRIIEMPKLVDDDQFSYELLETVIKPNSWKIYNVSDFIHFEDADLETELYYETSTTIQKAEIFAMSSKIWLKDFGPILLGENARVIELIKYKMVEKPKKEIESYNNPYEFL